MRSRSAAVLALCWLTACGDSGGESPDPGNTTESVGTSGTAIGDDTPEGMEKGGMPGVQPITRPEQTIAAGTLTPVNNSGVTGSVNLRGIGEQTEVSLNVNGLTDANRQVQVAIVEGSCAQAGREVAQIGPVPTGAGNIAAITDTVPLPPGTVLNGQHALVVKGQNAGPATPPLSCAVLPEWQRLPPTG
jgi:hypothetical protein